MPCPENLINKIAKKKKIIEEIFEKKKHESESKIVVKSIRYVKRISS